MSQSRTLFIGMDVHKDAIAIAYVAQDHGAEVMNLGTLSTRQGDIDQLIRKRQSKATHLIFVYEAGPFGSHSNAGAQACAVAHRLQRCVMRESGM
jgi:hypothetical protein